MRQLKITNEQQNVEQSSMGVIARIEYLAEYDMIYIYHHLSKGAQLELRKDLQHPLLGEGIAVYFKGFKLGYVEGKEIALLSNWIKTKGGLETTAMNVYKNKYMPLDGLDILVKPTNIDPDLSIAW